MTISDVKRKSGTSEVDTFGATEVNGKSANIIEAPPDDGAHVDFLDVPSWKDRGGEWQAGSFLKPHKQRLTVANWKERFSRHQSYAEKAVGGGYVQGYADADRRAKDRMTFLSIIAFDIDDGQSFDEVADRMRQTGLDAVVHTSWSHRVDKDGVVGDRFRIIIRLARRCPIGVPVMPDGETIGGPNVWKRLYRLIAAHLGLTHDEMCEDAARLMFYPSCPREMLPSARVVLFDGVGLDWTQFAERARAELAAERNERERKRRERMQRHADRQCDLDEMGDAELDAELKQLRTHLSHIDPDLDYPDWFAVIVGVHAKFHESPIEDEAMQEVIDWSSQGRKFEEKALGEVEKIWEGASSGGEGNITYGTVVHHAKAGGFDPEKADREAYEKRQRELKALVKKLRKPRIA